jgi:hypothetical protein
MGTLKLILGFAVIVAVVIAASQIIPPELANYSFQDDLRNIAVMGGANPNRTDEDIKNAVLNKAKEHEIPLVPEQVTVQHIGTPGAPAIFVAADYSVAITLPGYSFSMHFTPSSGNKGF